MAVARALVVGALLLSSPRAALAQDRQAPGAETAPDLAPYDGRFVAEVRLTGLDRISEQFARNQLRTQEGRQFRAQTVTEDIQRLHRTGAFSRVNASVELLADGGVAVIYTVVEARIIQDVQVVGNRNITDQQLAPAVGLLKGTPADEYQLGLARRNIEKIYRDKGYYQARVTIDDEELARSGVVLFRIREGERVRVTDIRFVGNDAFDARELRSPIRTRTANWFKVGPLDNAVLEADTVALVRFYRDRGYLDARADREIIPSPNGREAIVTFVIEEGPRYTLRAVTVRPAGAAAAGGELVLTAAQIAGLMELKPGDVYSVTVLRRSVEAISKAYEKLGYVDAQVRSNELRALDSPEVDLLLVVDEGRRFLTGEVIVQGNTITRDHVIRRQVQVKPERPLDEVALDETRRRLNTTRLFVTPGGPGASDGVSVTIQPEQPEAPGYRDVVIEVEETNTGSLQFGAAISSDSGVVGSISLTESNFDVTNPPDSWGELFSGRAFRGGGQEFNITLAPGFELQTYSISLTEPYLFGTNNSFGAAVYYRDRRYSDHDENRIGARLRLGRRFGDRWTSGLSFRAENIELSDIDSDAPVDLFEVEDPSRVLGLGVQLVRTTVPPTERLLPGRGARTELSAEQVFGDYTFNKLGAEHTLWLTVFEDFLGRRGILSMRTSANYIPQDDEAPIFERYFQGGRGFRGFDFRGVSPRGIRADTGELGSDPVGGEWSFFAGLEYQHPIWGDVEGRPVVAVATFLDTGTVTNDIGFDDYRVSVGFGLRLLLPISPAPLAFDFGFPLAKEDGDDTQLFSFTVDLPF